MKKILFLFSVFLYLAISTTAFAASWRFTWSNTEVHIPVGESINKYKSIPKAELYKDGILLNDATITYNYEGDWMYYLSDVNTSKIGEYEVWYKAYETNKYYPGTCPGYKCLVKFIVEDKIKPVIDIINPSIKIRRGSEYDFNSNVIVSDNYDNEPIVSFEHNIDINTIGLYEVNVIAKDVSKNISSASFNVEIYETSKPTIIYKNSGKLLKVPYKMDFSLSDYFEAFDSIDGDLTKYIKYPTIDNSKIGKDIYEFSVTNFAGISSSIMVEVEVVDEEPPSITLNDSILILDYKTNLNSYNFLNHITIVDNMPIDNDNIKINHNIKNEVGSYVLTYTYSDSTYDVSQPIEVKMKSFDKPIIKVDNITCYQNEAIDICEYIEVIDPSDPNILDSLVIYDEKVDYYTEGTYEAEAYVINSSGLSETATFTIKIILYEEELSTVTGSDSLTLSDNSSNSLSLIDIILLVIICGLVILVSIITFKYKRNKRTN